MPDPKRHHYIPEAIQRNFTNGSGQLFHWRRSWARDDVRPAAPKNLFVEGELYTHYGSDGAKDRRVETQLFARRDSDAAEFVAKLLPIIRAGKTPSLDEGAWEFWRRFIYYQMKRVPMYMRNLVERTGSRGIVELAMKEARGGDPVLTRAEIDVLENASELDRLVRNTMVVAYASPPSPEVRQALAGLGLTIMRAPRNKGLSWATLPLHDIEPPWRCRPYREA